MALFSRLFWPYDLYGFGGLGVIGTKNDSDEALGNDGVHVGPHFGGGIHVYFHEAVAVSIEFSDTLIKNNPSGRNIDLVRDVTRGRPDSVTRDDNRIGNHVVVLFGLSGYLPFDAPRSR
jgi:hypothetical protein